MALLFGEYDLLMRSGLFDPDFYRVRYPDVAALNLDPLTHYLERGCHERRDPGAGFDTSYYLEQCLAFGMTPDNPLLHYLTVGAKQGLIPHPAAAVELHIDVPRISGDSVLKTGGKGLSIVGWAHAAAGIQSVDIRVDDKHVIFARLGLPRPDVPKAFKRLAHEGHCGYAAYIPAGALGQGIRNVTLEARTPQGKTRSTQFVIDVGAAAATDPASSGLRTRVAAAATHRCLSQLDRQAARPIICLIMASPVTSADRHAFQRTLESLSSQVYGEWKVRLAAPAPKTLKALSLPKLLGSLDGLKDHCGVLSDEETFDLIMPLRVGDRLAADALLEFALAAANDGGSELFYSDDRRPDAATGDLAAFHKPGWSPDLLAALNYLGRAWCVRQSALERERLTLGDFARLDAHEAALRLTRGTTVVRHLPVVLHETAAALAPVEKHDRNRIDAKVSIIVPLDGHDDDVRSGVASLRRQMRYRNLEVICVVCASCPRAIRRELHGQVDQVIALRDPYQWALYCNRGAQKAAGQYLLFLDPAVAVRSERWLVTLLRYMDCPNRGVVGPILEAPEGTIAQAGCILGPDGALVPWFRGHPVAEAGSFGLAALPRNVVAVSHSVLLTASDTFRREGGFCEDLPADLSAADYCLKLRQQGLHHVVVPEARVLRRTTAMATAVAEEAASRFRRRWSKTIDRGDPYVNPNLSREGLLDIEREPVQIVHPGAPLFSSTIRRILIIKLDHIGDCVTALPAVRQLKKHFPDAELTVLCASGTAPLWRAEPTVAATMEFNLFKARSGDGIHDVTEQDRRQLAEQLTAKEFDLAVDLRKQPDSRHILEECGARVRAGFDHAGRFPWLDVALEWDEDVPLRPKHGHVSFDLIALVDRIAHAAAPEEGEPWPATAPLTLPRNIVRQLSAKPLVCVHPAAGSPMRQWPPERFGGLIELLLDQQYGVALIGGSDDAAIIADVLASTPSAKAVINLAGRLQLAELPSLLRTAVLFIGNNSGPQHLAAALSVPTLGIHSGVVDATEWGPRGANAVAIRRQMSCSPCFLNTPSECQRGLACLTGLTVADVLRACATLLPARIQGPA